ncbi:arsenite methyltransferase [Cellulomonas sp. NPDC057328]|uniref:arsenite methyltransferase n=1 Tax=Cellulomonas sp. NPDC057328 TaxID=3346101 RepID=UPI003633F3D0
MTSSDLRPDVRDKYAAAAAAALEGGCCAPSDPGVIGATLYADVGPDVVPDTALLSSLGCGNPTAVAALAPGETVLDLGSGGGLDVILSARRVGPAGRAYGVDALPEMLELARQNAAEAGVTNVEFLEGMLEEVPLPDASVDVVISNCVINLSEDKPAVFAEMARVLRTGGRIGVSDVVAEDRLTAADRAERGSYADCVAGALSESEYRELLRAAGFRDVTVEFTHAVAEGMHGAIVRAAR